MEFHIHNELIKPRNEWCLLWKQEGLLSSRLSRNDAALFLISTDYYYFLLYVICVRTHTQVDYVS
jgi:hypothetical protein